MDIKRCGSQPSGKGPAEWFTGTVRIDPLFQATAPARALGASVTFEPGARTAWHTHPLGQTLIVTAGCGLAQRWGGPVEVIRPGDVVWFPPGESTGTAPADCGWLTTERVLIARAWYCSSVTWLHPLDHLAVERLLDGVVRMAVVGAAAPVPVLLARREPDHVARPDHLDRPPQRCARPQPAVTIRVWPSGACATPCGRRART